MHKTTKLLLGICAGVGASVVAYHVAVPPQTRAKIQNGAKKVLAAGQEWMENNSGQRLSFAQRQEIERNQEWIQEQWERAGF